MKSQKFMPVKFVLLSAMLLMIAFIAGCDSNSSDEETTGTVQIMSLTASPSSIDVGDNCVIVATVSDGSSVLPGYEISFAVSATYGTLSNNTDTTEVNGEASTIFSATQAGTAIITAQLTEDVTRTVSVVISDTTSGGTEPTGSGNVHLTAYPTILTGDGIDSSLITVTVFDANGNVAPDGTLIHLTAGEKFDDIDDNGFFTTGVDTVIYDVNSNGMWDPIGSIIDTISVSGGNGQAQVYYTSGTLATTVYIRATVVTEGYQGYGQTTVQLNATAEIASISMSAKDIHLAVKQTGGLETSKLYATGYDSYGNPVPAGIPINFIITDGPDTSAAGEHLGNLSGAGKRGPYLAYTNSVGIAECPISSGTIPGTIRSRAYADTILSNSTQIMVHAGPPAYISVASEDCNVDYWDRVGNVVGITAIVKDAWNNPVADSTVVYFSTDEGVMVAHEARTEGENGIATSEWYSFGADQVSADGIVWIYAETGGGTVVDSSAFLNTYFPDTMWFTNFPSSLPADGKESGYLEAQVRDLNNLYVVNKYLVDTKIDVDPMTTKDRENGDGCHSSYVSANVVSTVLDQDYSLTGGDDDGIGRIEYLTVRYPGGASVSAPCSLLTEGSYRANCALNVENTSPRYDEVVYFSVQIVDVYGNPLGDHTIVASATAGTIPVNTYETNTFGVADGFRITMPAAASGITSLTITVQDLDPRGNSLTLQQKIEIATD